MTTNDKLQELVAACLIDQLSSFIEADREQAVLAARNEYPWHKIAQHGTYNVPTTDLDADPSGETITYQECYLLPKAWVDSELQHEAQKGSDPNE